LKHLGELLSNRTFMLYPCVATDYILSDDKYIISKTKIKKVYFDNK
jgi:hypothetical protein